MIEETLQAVPMAVPLIQEFSQEDVKVVPELTIDSYEEEVHLGEVEEMRGGVHGAVERTWYIVTIDGIEYYYYKYDFASLPFYLKKS